MLCADRLAIANWKSQIFFFLDSLAGEKVWLRILPMPQLPESESSFFQLMNQ